MIWRQKKLWKIHLSKNYCDFETKETLESGRIICLRTVVNLRWETLPECMCLRTAVILTQKNLWMIHLSKNCWDFETRKLWKMHLSENCCGFETKESLDDLPNKGNFGRIHVRQNYFEFELKNFGLMINLSQKSLWLWDKTALEDLFASRLLWFGYKRTNEALGDSFVSRLS